MVKNKYVIFGVGGLGCNIITTLAPKLCAESTGNSAPKVTCIALETDTLYLQRVTAQHKILLGEKNLEGKGTGRKPNLAYAAAAESSTCLLPFLNEATTVIIIAGLGGGTGSGAGKWLLEQAKNKNIRTLVIATLPYQFEGTKIRQNAENQLVEYCCLADLVVTFPWKDLLRNASGQSKLADIAASGSLSICNALQALLRNEGKEDALLASGHFKASTENKITCIKLCTEEIITPATKQPQSIFTSFMQFIRDLFQ